MAANQGVHSILREIRHCLCFNVPESLSRHFLVSHSHTFGKTRGRIKRARDSRSFFFINFSLSRLERLGRVSSGGLRRRRRRSKSRKLGDYKLNWAQLPCSNQEKMSGRNLQSFFANTNILYETPSNVTALFFSQKRSRTPEKREKTDSSSKDLAHPSPPLPSLRKMMMAK